MRRFVVLGHTQRVDPPLPLDDLGGMGGRWDVLARAVVDALLTSHGVRRDTEVVSVVNHDAQNRTLRWVGAEIERLNPDERSTAALASKALEVELVGEHEEVSTPGVYVSRRSLRRVLEDAGRQGAVVWLRENAEQFIGDWKPAESADHTFVLSDHRDPSPQEETELQQSATHSLTLGPVSLQGHQCITLVHAHLDRAGAITSGKR